MSVQAGLWNFEGKPISRRAISDLVLSLNHTGADSEPSLHLEGSIALVYSAFHTTPESRHERQPYKSSGNSVFTWDGRLDNRDDILARLDCTLTARATDVEIVAAVFDRWGTDGLQWIVGDWALVVWQPEKGELVLACDYMAIRHLFYYLAPDGIFWATDLTPLISLSPKRFHLDEEYIAGYFANDPESCLTPYRELRQVPAGGFVRVCGNRFSVESYWRLASSDTRYKSDGEYEAHFRQLFRQAVRRRLRSDSPVLAELSGGLDSSSIVCVADSILENEGMQLPRVDTISYEDMAEPNADDPFYRNRIERDRGRPGVHVSCNGHVEMGQFRYDGFAALPGYLGTRSEIEVERARVLKEGGYRVVLSGLGGDEFLGGVPNPSAELADLLLQMRFGTLIKRLLAWSLAKRRPVTEVLWMALLELVPPSITQHVAKDACIEPWIDKRFARRFGIALRRLKSRTPLHCWLPSKRAYCGGVILMGNKMAKRSAGIRIAEEFRYPYLDQSLINFIFSIPPEQLLRPGERRSLMRRALVAIVPHEVLQRKTKQLTTVAPRKAIAAHLQELAVLCDNSNSHKLGFVNSAAFVETLRDAANGKPVHIVRLLKAISLEIWLRDLARHSLVDFADAKCKLHDFDALGNWSSRLS